MKILLMEDDPTLLEILEEHLSQRGDSLTLAKDGLQAEERVAKEQFDLLLLDVNVPHLSGFEFLQSLRESGDMTPAIFITSLNSSKDLCHGFSIGADDYIKKPFDFDELDARIDKFRKRVTAESRIEIGQDITFNPHSFQLIINGSSTLLRKKESELLQCLIAKRGSVVSLEEIISTVWRYEEPPLESTIRTYIKNLRKLLGEESIENIRGVGYLFK